MSEHPADLIGEAFRQAFYPDLIEEDRTGDGRRLAQKATLILAGIAIVPALLIGVFAEPLFSFVFGADWARAGTYASALVLLVVSGFVNIPSVSLITVLGLQRVLLINEIAALILRCLAIFAGAAMDSDYMAVLLYVAVGVSANAVLIGYGLTRNARQIA